MAQIEDFPEVSAEYWFDVENGVAFVNIALMHGPDAEAAELAELEETNSDLLEMVIGHRIASAGKPLRRVLQDIRTGRPEPSGASS